jgi:hypothetical protein
MRGVLIKLIECGIKQGVFFELYSNQKVKGGIDKKSKKTP